MKRILGFALSALLLAASVNSVAPHAVAAVQDTATKPYSNEVLGLTLHHPANWRVVPDEVLFAVHGATFVNEKSIGPNRFDGDSDVRLGMRLGMVVDATADQLEEYVNKDLTEYAALNPDRFTVKVGPYQGVALYPMPGIEVGTHIFVVANDRLYKIVVPGEVSQNANLLSSFRFTMPTKSVHELDLMSEAASLAIGFAGELPHHADEALHKADAHDHGHEDTGGGDVGIMAASGCVDFPSTKGMQTQWAYNARGGAGTSWAGPSFWNEGYHLYCNRTNGSNDYYAMDHSLYKGDTVYSAWSGTVVFAKWTCDGWASYGKMVIVNLGDGYYNMMAHLDTIEVSNGAWVSDATRIGGAGGSGYGSLSYWSPHLHQVTYKNPNIASCGPYGGQSAMPTKVKYYGNGGGYYTSFYRGMVMSW